MIRGNVSNRGEAILRLRLLSPTGASLLIDALLDTGFNGFLTLPRRQIESLHLQSAGIRDAVLADGSLITTSTHTAMIRWHDSDIDVLVVQAEGTPLAGMALLEGSRVTLDVIANGDVTIQPLA